MEIVAKDYMGAAWEEMRVAAFLDKIANQEDNTYARNKALQSAGMAIELLYKALICSQGKTAAGTHKIAILHTQIRMGDDKQLVEQYLRDAGWRDVSEWTSYLDNSIDHAQRKYHMYDPDGRRIGISYATDGAASVGGLAEVYQLIFSLADAKNGFRESMVRQRTSKARINRGLRDPGGLGGEIGPLIAQINLSGEPDETGEVRVGLRLDRRTGETRILTQDEVPPSDQR